MRIGRFADSNKITIDTIRHYIDIGLIVPEKKNGQYYFEERCESDLKEILDLKSLGFTLSEIKIILNYRRFGKLTPYKQVQYYNDIFYSKAESLDTQINELIKVRGNLKKKIEQLFQDTEIERSTIGIDIGSLSRLKCLKCKGSLILAKGDIDNNQITYGTLRCSCGESYHVESGILKVDNTVENSIKSLEYNYTAEYISEYINETDVEYLESLYKGLDWGSKRLSSTTLENKVILELGSGTGFFLRNIYEQLPESCLYIAVDNNMQKHKFLKEALEKSGIKKNILFICSDFLEIPIDEKSIDILLDMSGTSNYSFEHEEFLLKLTDRYIKDSSYLLGSYILFKNFHVNTLIKELYRGNFTLEKVKRDIGDLKYACIDERKSGYLDRGGKYESYFIEGEKIYSYMFYGKR